jgi:hypothetical protein
VDPLKTTVWMNSTSRMPVWQGLSFIVRTTLTFGLFAAHGKTT